MTECKSESLRDVCMNHELHLEVTRLLVASELEIEDFVIKLWFYKNKDAIYSNWLEIIVLYRRTLTAELASTDFN